jgi:hypothetical protein
LRAFCEFRVRSQEGAQLRLYRLLHKPLRALDATSVLGREVDHEVETALDDALGMSEVDGAGVGETMLDQTEIEA